MFDRDGCLGKLDDAGDQIVETSAFYDDYKDYVKGLRHGGEVKAMPAWRKDLQQLFPDMKAMRRRYFGKVKRCINLGPVDRSLDTFVTFTGQQDWAEEVREANQTDVAHVKCEENDAESEVESDAESVDEDEDKDTRRMKVFLKKKKIHAQIEAEIEA